MKLKKELKFRSTIEQTETYTCNAAQVISQYLKTLRNEYTIDDTQVFSKHIKDLPPLQEDEEACPMMWNLCLSIFPLIKPLNIFQIKYTATSYMF